MATEYVGSAIPAPGFRRGNVSDDLELLYSTARFTQKGVTLEAGQGVLPLGSLLSYNASTKRYVKYDNSAGDGIAHGALRTSVDTGTVSRVTDPEVGEYQGNIVISGILKLGLVRAGGAALTSDGTGDAAVADLGGRRDYIRGTFIF